MRVISRTRAAAPSAWTPRAILAAFAISAVALAGCGQRGALYMPNVPPLPPKPNFETAQPENGAATPASAPESASAPVGTVPDTSGTPLSLSPDSELSTTPATGSPQTASDATPTQ